MATPNLSNFPAGFIEKLPKGQLDDHYGKKRFGFSLGRNTEVVAPFDHEFQFESGALRIAPVRLGEILHTQRNILSRWLSGAEINIAQASLDKTAVLVVGEENDVRSAYPNANIQKQGSCWIVVQEREDVYQRCMQTVRSSTPVESIVDHRSTLMGKSLLTPEKRKVLENLGEIVFESDPRGADRLVICVKHAHGTRTSAWELAAMDAEASNRFTEHQEHFGKLTRELLPVVGSDRMHLFLETFPEQSGDEEERRLFNGRIEEILQAKSAARNIRRSHAQHDAIPFLRRLLGNGQDTILRSFLPTGSREKIHGDGRVPHEQKFRGKSESLQWDKAVAAVQGGGVGVASDLSRRKHELDAYIMNTSHRGLTKNIAAALNRGETGLLAYGAGHFESGIPPKDRMEGIALEQYLTFIPGTQVVVVEPHDYQRVVNDFSAMDALVNGLTVEGKRQLAETDFFLEGAIFTLTRALDSGHEQEYENFSDIIKRLMERRGKILRKEKVPKDIGIQVIHLPFPSPNKSQHEMDTTAASDAEHDPFQDQGFFKNL